MHLEKMSSIALALGHGSVRQSRALFAPLGGFPRHPMSTEDMPEKPSEESAQWHWARAKGLRKNGFTKMAEEHEQIAQAIERRRREQENK